MYFKHYRHGWLGLELDGKSTSGVIIWMVNTDSMKSKQVPCNPTEEEKKSLLNAIKVNFPDENQYAKAFIEYIKNN